MSIMSITVHPYDQARSMLGFFGLRPVFWDQRWSTCGAYDQHEGLMITICIFIIIMSDHTRSWSHLIIELCVCSYMIISWPCLSSCQSPIIFFLLDHLRFVLIIPYNNKTNNYFLQLRNYNVETTRNSERGVRSSTMEPSNLSTILGSCLPPLFWRRLPLPCVIHCRFPLSPAARRCTNNISRACGGFFVWRVTQRR